MKQLSLCLLLLGALSLSACASEESGTNNPGSESRGGRDLGRLTDVGTRGDLRDPETDLGTLPDESGTRDGDIGVPPGEDSPNDADATDSTGSTGGGDTGNEDAGGDTAVPADPGDTGDGGASGDTGSESDAEDEPGCIPFCDGRSCGLDGCGGVCGTCAIGSVCDSGNCKATSGSLSCNDIIDCINACPAGADACVLNCYNTGTVPAQTQMSELLDCIGEYCAGDMTPAQFEGCQELFCPDEVAACHGSSSTGDTCWEVVICWLTCTGSGCERACENAGTPNGTLAARDYLACSLDICWDFSWTVGDYFECADFFCPFEAWTCDQY